MDVSFSNVLEGARQYFQGLPAGGGGVGAGGALPAAAYYPEAAASAAGRPHPAAPAAPAASAAAAGWTPHHLHQPQPPQDAAKRLPSREQTPIQRPSSHSSDGSRPPSHPQYMQDLGRQYHNPYQDHQASQNFQFSRPQSRELSNHQYATHVAVSSPYQPPSSPQVPRAPSREQLTQPIHSQTFQPPHSQNYQSIQQTSRSQQQNYEASQSQNYETHSKQGYNSYQRSYYPVQSQTTTNSSNNFLVTSQSYPSSSSQNNYYKHIYSTQIQTSQHNQYGQPKPVNSYQEHQQINTLRSGTNESSEQSIRTTHNLPPIAAISNYNKCVKDPSKNANKIPSSNSYSTNISYLKTPNTNSSTVFQQNVSRSASYTSSTMPNDQQNTNYGSYNNQSQQNYPYSSSSTTQSYQSVIVTSNTSNYTPSNQTQSSSSTPYSQPSKITQNMFKCQEEPLNSNHYNMYQQPTNNHVNERLVSVVKQKRESPLDLSVKTVRTPADSTLEESEPKFYQRPSAAHPGISTHSYPTLDVHSIQRNFTQRSLPTATAPKVEFHPNFNVPPMNQISKANTRIPDDSRRDFLLNKTYPSSVRQEPRTLIQQQQTSHNSYPGVSTSTSSYINSYIQGRNVHNSSNGNQDCQQQYGSKKNMYPYELPEINKKRSSEIPPPVIPNKVPKVETWRQSIDLQIEQKLSNYEKEQFQRLNAIKSTNNGNYSSINNSGFKDKLTKPVEKSKEMFNYQKHNFDSGIQHNISYNSSSGSYMGGSHNQNYIASSGSQQYHGYQQQHSQGLNPSSRSFSNSSLTSNKGGGSPGVDKRVLSLLRNSLEVKGQKKLEQQRSMENLAHQASSEIQHPSTDVTAPVQPKTILTGRNASPFTSTSFPENSVTSMYKIDKPNFEQGVKVGERVDADNTVLPNRITAGGDFDGLAAAFLAAARMPVRTKGELKQVLSHNTNNVSDARLHEFIENQLKSPIRQDTSQDSSAAPSSSTISTTTASSTSPVKTLKERQNTFVPRKRLFSRNEDEQGNFPRDKSGLRSSSETSVFDFPDSDSENEMPVLERQSLNSMRKDRSLLKYPALSSKLDRDKYEILSRPASPEDDMFAKLCDNFVEQLRHDSPLNKLKYKKGEESEDVVKIDSILNSIATDTNSSDIKVEKIDIKQENIEIIPDEITNDETQRDPKEDGKLLLTETEGATQNNVSAASEDNNILKQSVLVSDDSDNEVLAIKLEIMKEHKTHVPKNVKVEVCKSPAAVLVSENKIGETQTEYPKPSIIKKVEGIKEGNIKGKSDISPQKTNEIQIIRPAKKPSFGDGSDFYPGWEEGVYKYKKSLRMPPSLIQVTRPPASMRLSTSLPDLDPCPQSPTASLTATDTDSKEPQSNKKTLRKVKTDPTDSDSESTSSFNIFSKINYDSEGSSSITSLPNTKKESQSIIDKLLERYGGKKRKKYKRKEDHSPKVIPKAENPVELLPTPSLEVKKKEEGEIKELKKLKSPVIKAESVMLGFRKDTINNFKDAFINSSNNILGVHDKFATVVLKSRTRKESRVLKQRTTIKEVFGEDRPASAPPVTCVNNIEIKQELEKDDVFSSSLQEIVIKKEIVEEVNESNESPGDIKDTKQLIKSRLLDRGSKKNIDKLLKTLTEKNIKTEVEVDDEVHSLHEMIIKKDPDSKSETPSLDGDEASILGRKRNKYGKIRRKFSSGFDYLRKKRKVKKDNVENEGGEKKEKKRKGLNTKIPESIDDIQKEVKSWVLNKGIGESHLHRAARLGYADVVAYCLEKMDCHPSPKDNAGYTPLHEACSRGHLDIAKLLLKYGANVHESAQGGIRPLHEAVENGFIEIIRLLLSYGADPTLATYAGVVPLDLVSDDDTKNLLINHMNDMKGEEGPTWSFYGPASCFDPVDEIGYNLLDDVPEPNETVEEDDVDIEMSEMLLPNLYTLRGEPSSDRWVLLQDLSNILKIKSRDALLRQICPPSTSSANVNYKSGLRELKMTDFLDQARCCQFLNQGEKINTRASKIALVKYTDKVRELLGIENVVVTNR